MPIELDCRELLDLAAITPSPSGTLRGRGAGRFHSRTSEAPYSQALASGDAWGSPSAAALRESPQPSPPQRRAAYEASRAAQKKLCFHGHSGSLAHHGSMLRLFGSSTAGQPDRVFGRAHARAYDMTAGSRVKMDATIKPLDGPHAVLTPRSQCLKGPTRKSDEQQVAVWEAARSVRFNTMAKNMGSFTISRDEEY